jgi:hypothetical protein
MAGPGELGPFAPLLPEEEAAAPWGWVPPEWLGGAAAMPAPTPAPSPIGATQPGLGIPTETLDAALPPPPPEPTPYIGFPRVPGDAQPLAQELPAPMGEGMPGDATALPTGEPGVMQPGLGIPQGLVDQAVRGQVRRKLDAGVDPLTGAPFAPAEDEIDFETGTDFSTREAKTAAVETMSDEDLAGYEAELGAQREAIGTADRVTLARKQAEQAEQALVAFKTSRAEAAEQRAAVEADAAKLAAEKVTPEGWYEEGGLGRTAAAFLAAALGGLTQHLNGGRNLGLEAVDRAIDRHLATRQAELGRKQTAIGERRRAVQEQGADAEQQFREAALIRAQVWDTMERTIAAEQGAYAPDGTTAAKMEIARRAVMAKKAASMEAYEAAVAKRREEQIKTQLLIAKQAEDERANRAREATDRTRAAADLTRAKAAAAKDNAETKNLLIDNEPQSVETLRRLFPTAPPEAFSGPKSIKRFKADLDILAAGSAATKAGADATVAAGQARLETSGPGGSPYAVGMPDGTPITTTDPKTGETRVLEVKDPVKRQEALSLVESAANITAFVDKLTILSEKSGGAWDSLNSDEVQELRSLASAIDFETFVGFGLGAPSEGDKALAADARGGDVTSFKNRPIAGLQTFARSVQQKVNTKLGVIAGRKGPPIEFARVKPTTEPSERSVTELIGAWDSAVLRSPTTTIEEKKAEANAALGQADALARKAPPELIRVMAQQLRERVEAGWIEPVDAAKAQKALRTQFGRKLTEGGPGEVAARLEALGVPGDQVNRLLLNRNALNEAELDALLGFEKAAK